MRDMRMPNNPNSWPDLYDVMHSWWRGETPIGAVVMACGMAVIRIAYTGGGWKKMILEGLLCGALTLTFASALEYLDLPKSISIAIGGGIGFIGVDAFRAFALRFIGNRFGVNDDNQRQ
ncbi:Holin (Lysis protein 13) [Erwinia pyrifoliae DSM 12163]|nr:Holin (Lysis protein 13) [Erwinia pyrifoliae DSM 12163]